MRGDLLGLLAALPSGLQTLALGSNSINTTLSSAWELPTELDVFDVSNNYIRPDPSLGDAAFPADFPFPPALRVLKLQDNLLRGTLPAAMSFPSTLREIWCAWAWVEC